MSDPIFGDAEVLEVSVPVATMWTTPDAPRDIDELAVSDAPDVAEWAASMVAVVRKGLTGRTLTQLLLGEPVHVLEHAGEWVRVAALWQPSSAHPSGYPGWVRRRHLGVPVSTGPRVVVTAPRASLSFADGPALEVSFGTSLVATGSSADGAVAVLVPTDGEPRVGTLRAADVAVPAAGPSAGPAASGPLDVLGSAAMFLGLRYLWGGTSSWGLDCSGLVHLVFRAHGVEVPRDAFDQADWVEPVPLDDVEPGDLYFFARPGERVYHVGFVSQSVGADGVRRMLHAPEGGELVEDAPLAPHRLETLVSAGRMPRG